MVAEKSAVGRAEDVGEPVVWFQPNSWQAGDPGRANVSVWSRERPMSQLQAVGQEELSLTQPFCPLRIFRGLEEGHQLERAICFIQSTTQMWVSSKNTRTDTSRITFGYISGDCMVRSSWHIKVILTVAISGALHWFLSPLCCAFSTHWFTLLGTTHWISYLHPVLVSGFPFEGPHPGRA